MPSAKDLDQHCRDRSFRARIEGHRQLLETSPPPASERLATLQARYRACTNEYERRHIAVQFERATREPDPDEQAALEAEQAEFEDIVCGPPAEIVDDEIGRTIDRQDRAALARDLRNGAPDGRRLTWREIGQELGVSASTARRLVVSP